MMTKRVARIQDEFSGAFARAWERVVEKLAENGIAVGACVQNGDGILFRLTSVEPSMHYFGDDPLASISLRGVKFRADGTWGTHVHWVGCADDLRPEGSADGQ